MWRKIREGNREAGRRGRKQNCAPKARVTSSPRLPPPLFIYLMRIIGLDHIVLRVRDMERVIAFWRDALGCEVEKVQADLGLVHIRAGNVLIDLVDISGKLGK